MILKQADDKQDDIDILHNLANQASSVRQRTDVQSEIDNIIAGMRGEQDASYYLDQEFRHRDDAVVIHDLRIEEEGDVAQIDHLVISRRRQAFVLETKALKAAISCNDAGEWEAVYGKDKYPIASPLEQCKRHAAVLRRWLGRRETSLREVIPVVLVAPTTRLGQRAASPDDPEIVKSDLFPRWYDQKTHASTTHIVQRGNELMTEDELAGIGYRLIKSHTPIKFDWRKRFGFPSLVDVDQDVSSTIITPPTAADEPTQDVARRKHIGKAIVPILGGSITVFRYENGDRAIRCDDDSLRQKVADACRQNNGRWVPFPKFWLLSFDACKIVIQKLGGNHAPNNKQLEIPESKNATFPIQQTERTKTEKNNIPDALSTKYGEVRVMRLTDGRYALRHGTSSEIINIVKTACKGKGQWNPKYKNWIVSEDRISEVIGEITN